jgi:hypothetical protein
VALPPLSYPEPSADKGRAWIPATNSRCPSYRTHLGATVNDAANYPLKLDRSLVGLGSIGTAIGEDHVHLPRSCRVREPAGPA